MYLTKEQELQISKAFERQHAMKMRAFVWGLLVASAIWIAIFLLRDISVVTNGNI